MAYTWKNHPRNITDYQPQDGCVIDAMSLDDAMKDVVDWINSVPSSSIKTRWLSHTACAGWSPASQYQSYAAASFSGVTTTPRQYPFLKHLNAIGAGSFVGTQPDRFANRQRVKGCEIPGMDSNDADSKSYQLIWTIPLAFPSPCVLRSVDLTMLVDDQHGSARWYDNKFTYDASGGAREIPKGYNDKDPMENMSIVVHVDHTLASEKRGLNDVEVAIHNVSTAAGGVVGNPTRRRTVSGIMIPSALSGTWQDMSPSRLGGALEGIQISEEVNVPLRPGARVRIAIVIPVDDAGATVFPGWNSTVPQLTQQWNLSYTWMEALS